MELQLDELRSYLYANANAVQGYAKAFRKGRRASTAHVESTVNQLINWRFCKKQQMSQTEQARKPCCMSRQQLSTERLPDTQAGSASASCGIRPHLFYGLDLNAGDTGGRTSLAGGPLFHCRQCIEKNRIAPRTFDKESISDAQTTVPEDRPIDGESAPVVQLARVVAVALDTAAHASKETGAQFVDQPSLKLLSNLRMNMTGFRLIWPVAS